MKENFVEFEGENKGCKISVVMKIIIYIISDTDGATYLKKKKKNSISILTNLFTYIHVNIGRQINIQIYILIFCTNLIRRFLLQ